MEAGRRQLGTNQYFCIHNLLYLKKLLIHLSFVVLLGLLLSPVISHAQTSVTPANLKLLRAKEDSLKRYARDMITDSTTADRMKSDSFFTKIFIRSLVINNSFFFPFDSVKGISRLYAPDSSFRIFTWNLQFDDYYSRQRGAIQMRTRDGSLKLFPLRDVSEFTENPLDSARNRLNWIGAVYYNMVKTQYNNRNYYTLFGIDYNNSLSTRKWMEVLYFNQQGEPIFGGPFFSFEKDSIPQPTQFRYRMEFKKNARVLANYLPDLGVILLDHLISESDEPDNPWTYIPDGDNEAFKWENGKWVHIDKAFDFKIDMSGVDPYLGNPPVGDPILDARGNRNDKKLEEKSEKNRSKEQQKKIE